jgi:hypothetical protein
MNDETEALLLDLVEWVASTPRPYGEVMDAWRTSCPRLTIWEDALDRGLVERRRDRQGAALVAATESGHRLLRGANRF